MRRFGMRPRSDRRRGVALFLAVVTLAVVGALIAIAFPAALLESRGGRNAGDAVHALEAAEAGAASTASGWNPVWNGRPVGGDTTFAPVAMPAGARHTVTLTRLNATTWMIRSLGERVLPDGAVVARRLVSTLVRTVPADTTGADSLPRRLQGHAWTLLY